ncbi:hypothetical protein [Kitasatospora sp. NPDC085879]|uniref:hypothetical protein n=1 Tax=Kitasatospora sp. NPDC085879 TaxID=3154769 RepID=UPI00343FFBAE
MHQRPAASAPLQPGSAPAAAGATADDSAPLRLALAAERTSLSPPGRSLGAPTGTCSAEGGVLLVEGWEADPSVFAVHRPGDGPAVGWVATVGDDGGAFIDGRMVIDAADGEPWLSQDALYAVSLLRMALDQNLA